MQVQSNDGRDGGRTWRTWRGGWPAWGPGLHGELAAGRAAAGPADAADQPRAGGPAAAADGGRTGTLPPAPGAGGGRQPVPVRYSHQTTLLARPDPS